MEIVIFGIIIMGVFLYNKTIDGNKFLEDNSTLFALLKEDDYDFLVAAKYGDNADPHI